MTHHWLHVGRAGRTILTCLFSCLVAFGCRIRSSGPRWIETHGRGELTQIAGGPVGLHAIGTNGLAYAFPGPGGTWHEWSPQLRPLALAGTREGILYSDREHRVGYAQPGRNVSPSWTLASDVTGLVSDESGERAYAVSDGQVVRLLESGQVKNVCDGVRAVGITISHGQLWVSDAQQLYLETDDKCSVAPGTPARVTRLSGLADRLFVVDASGDVFRRLKDRSWQKLPRPRKFRADRMPHDQPVTDVAVTSTAAFALDNERTVFVLSESE
jgi:hypothetical protein